MNKLFLIKLFLLVLLMQISTVLNAAIDIEIDISATNGGGSAASSLQVSRAQLLFDNNSNSITVDTNEKLTAHVLIRYVGNGVLRSTWKVDGFPYHVEQQTLSFGSDLDLKSNNKFILPSFQSGKHKVEYTGEAIAPDGSVTNAVAVSGVYFVKRSDFISSSIKLILPFSGAAVNLNKAIFSWVPLKGAATYKLHLKEKDVTGKENNSRPVALTKDTRFVFSSRQASKYKYRQQYQWLVEGFNIKGVSIGVSTVFEFINLTPVKRVSVNNINVTPQNSDGSLLQVNQPTQMNAVIENIGAPLSDVRVEVKINNTLYDQQEIKALAEGSVIAHVLQWQPLKAGENEIQYQVWLGSLMIAQSVKQVTVADAGNDFLAVKKPGSVRGNDFVATLMPGSVAGNDFIATENLPGNQGNDFLATLKTGSVLGNDFIATIKADRSLSQDYIATPITVSVSSSSYLNLDFRGVPHETIFDDISDFIEQAATNGMGDATGVNFTLPITNLKDATGINFTVPISNLENAEGINFTMPYANLEDATGINFTLPDPGRNDVAGVDFIAIPQGNNDVAGVDFTVTAQGKNDVAGVDFTATAQGKNDVAGVDFTAIAQGKNDVAGVDFTATAQGKNDVAGVDFTATAQGKNDVAGVDFTATPQGKNDVAGVDFTATAQGKNDVAGVDFTATAQDKNDVTGVDFTATAQGENDVAGVDFTATAQGKNDVAGVDFIATAQGKNDVAGVDFTATAQGKNDVAGVDFTATAQGKNDVAGVDFTATAQGQNDVAGVDFVASKDVVINAPKLNAEGKYKDTEITSPVLKVEGRESR
jgi:hypothetical protein